MTSHDAQDDAVFKALSDPTRRRALDLLRERPMTTGELCARLERRPAPRRAAHGAEPALGRTGVLRHLAVLIDAGLIVTRTQGRIRWNHLNGAPLQRVCDRWMSRHVQVFASAVGRLKTLAETDDPPGLPAASAEPARSPMPHAPASHRTPRPERRGSAHAERRRNRRPCTPRSRT